MKNWVGVESDPCCTKDAAEGHVDNLSRQAESSWMSSCTSRHHWHEHETVAPILQATVLVQEKEWLSQAAADRSFTKGFSAYITLLGRRTRCYSCNDRSCDASDMYRVQAHIWSRDRKANANKHVWIESCTCPNSVDLKSCQPVHFFEMVLSLEDEGVHGRWIVYARNVHLLKILEPI